MIDVFYKSAECADKNLIKFSRSGEKIVAVQTWAKFGPSELDSSRMLKVLSSSFRMREDARILQSLIIMWSLYRATICTLGQEKI